jgi:hypothetical protein
MCVTRRLATTQRGLVNQGTMPLAETIGRFLSWPGHGKVWCVRENAPACESHTLPAFKRNCQQRVPFLLCLLDPLSMLLAPCPPRPPRPLEPSSAPVLLGPAFVLELRLPLTNQRTPPRKCHFPGPCYYVRASCCVVSLDKPPKAALSGPVLGGALCHVCQVPAAELLCVTEALTGCHPRLPGLAQKCALCNGTSCNFEPKLPLHQPCTILSALSVEPWCCLCCSWTQGTKGNENL